MKIKTSRLTGPALDWAVAKCLGATKIQPYEYNGRGFLRVYLDGEKLWIITEWDRSMTTILFPSEY